VSEKDIIPIYVNSKSKILKMTSKVYKLTNSNGVIIEFISLGARITSVKLPDGDKNVDIALGYDTQTEAENGDAFIGAICGRMANRIGEGKFNLKGVDYYLAKNDRTNHLHGGPSGFFSKLWDVQEISFPAYESAYKLSYISEDGEENYPGKLNIEIIYALNNENELFMDIKAITDKTTVVNLTSHPYFNLNGVGGGKIFNHFLEINANSFTPLNELGVPTGEIRMVSNTDMDFNTPVKISERINSSYEQIHLVGGLDHNWVINKNVGELALACRITEPESDRSVEVYTTQPGIQVYTGMHFDGTEVGKSKIPFTQYGGIALEAQNFPDAPNKPNFPTAVLEPGETYNEKIIYKFGF